MDKPRANVTPTATSTMLAFPRPEFGFLRRELTIIANTSTLVPFRFRFRTFSFTLNSDKLAGSPLLLSNLLGHRAKRGLSS
jgi:hypothetical protein